MDRIDHFRIFARVVECTSFTRAAETLGLPRSSVSAAVIGLEARLGTRLLHRTTRRVAPTPDGTAFYERCLRLVADVEDAESLFRDGAEGPSGELRIDMPGRIGRLIVAPALGAFLDAYPGMTISLGVSDRPVDLIEESVDCALRVGTVTEPGLVARSIGSLPLINVASPAYLRRHGTPESPADLPAHLAVGYASPAGGRVEPWEWVENGAHRTLPVRARVTANNAEAYIACCLAGLGLIQIPAYDVRAHVERGELVDLMPAHRAAPMPMHLVYSHRRHLSRRLRVFTDWLEALLRRSIAATA
ncbi:LysR family transcriptional regulator [Sphingomonas flavalba]|uniref:LysR family transcriptional regulator n=1 Tax=Sphingomonas flavalba TaxID=2559804 RepID=UPI00109DC8A2|nr:LysR family transcriptional regulator [Sphingomonas flavalba]